MQGRFYLHLLSLTDNLSLYVYELPGRKIHGAALYRKAGYFCVCKVLRFSPKKYTEDSANLIFAR